MELNVLLRGQSNAILLAQSPDWITVQTDVQQLLGFDGVTNKVNLLESDYSNATTPGNNTAAYGTAFVGDWLSPNGGAWQNGWTNTSIENGLLGYIDSLPADEKAAPTAVVWLQNEYDSTNPTLTTAEWMNAVEQDAAQVRAAFGQSAATTPYVFVNAIPYGSNLIDSTNQAIKLGMELFASNPGFHATIGAQANDVSMDYGQTGSFGGPHMDTTDANLVDHRLALSIAETFSQYALPGSPLATGQIDAYGPEVMAAQMVSGNQMLVTVALDAGVGLNGSLSGDAAAGVGWSVFVGGQKIDATSAQVTSSNQLLLTFSGTIPPDGSATLYYGYGYGRLATSDSDPGQGTAVYDAQQMPIWAPASGVTVQGDAAGSFVEQNLVTNGVAWLTGSVSPIAGYDSEIAAVTPDSVAIVALSANAVLLGGLGTSVLVATSGNNLLDAGQGTTLMVGGSGNDNFVVNASGSAGVFHAISNFHAGDTLVLWGFTPGASQLSWSDDGGGNALLTAVGGGIGGGAMVDFDGVSAQQAAGFTQTTGTAGGMNYLAVTSLT